MNQLNLLDKDLQKLSSQNISISILLSSDGYCFSVKDDTISKYMAFESVPGSFSFIQVYEAFKNYCEQIWGKGNIPKVENLVYAERKSIVIPKAFSSSDQLMEIIDFHFPVQFKSHIIRDEYNDHTIAYLVNAEDHRAAMEYFNPKHVKNIAYSMMTTALKYAQGLKSDAVHVQVWGEYIDVLVIKDSRLMMFNTYRCKTGNDMVYFILNVYKKLMLNPQTCPVMLSGWIQKNDNAIVQLNKFIKNMFFETLNSEKKYSFHFQDSLPHYFIHFLNID